MVTQYQPSTGQESLTMGVTVMSCLLGIYMWSETIDTMLEHIAVKLTMELAVPLIRQSVWLLTVSTVHFAVSVVRCWFFSEQTKYKFYYVCLLMWGCLTAELEQGMVHKGKSNWHLTKTVAYIVELFPAFLYSQISPYKMTVSLRVKTDI